MTDDPAEIQRRIAYLDSVKRVAMWHRQFGFVFCLIGVVLLTYATYRVPGGPRSPFGLTALGVIVVGWVLFAYSIFARTRYVRAHPFDSQP